MEETLQDIRIEATATVRWPDEEEPEQAETPDEEDE